MLLSSDIQPTGTWTLLENGVYNDSGPLLMDGSPARYTCSGNTLSIHSPSGSMELIRKSH
jgi:hypothetical protein